MKNMKLLICFAWITIFSASSCEKNPFVERVYSIKVQNNSNSSINFLVSYNYPDTIIPDQYNSVSSIRAKDYTPLDSKQEWSTEFAKTKAGKLSFFFFNPDTITNYGWEKVRSDYKILKRKEVTLQDVQNNQWTVTYP